MKATDLGNLLLELQNNGYGTGICNSAQTIVVKHKITPFKPFCVITFDGDVTPCKGANSLFVADIKDIVNKYKVQ